MISSDPAHVYECWAGRPDGVCREGCTCKCHQPAEPPVRGKLDLVGVDGNAFMIIGAVSSALRRAGATAEQVKQFQTEAMSGDYDQVLQTAMRWTEDD